MTPLIDNLRKQLDGPRDGALLRFSLASALLTEGQADQAIAQYRRALDFDRDYSAAWKLLGKALLDTGDAEAATHAWQQGMAAAARRGDKQAEREMRVFLRRLQRDGGNG